MKRSLFACLLFALAFSSAQAQEIEIDGKPLSRKQLKSLRADEAGRSLLEEYQTLSLEKNYLLYEKYMEENLALQTKYDSTMPAAVHAFFHSKIDSLSSLREIRNEAQNIQHDIIESNPEIIEIRRRANLSNTREEKKAIGREILQVLARLRNENPTFKKYEEIELDVSKRIWIAFGHYTLKEHRNKMKMIPLSNYPGYRVKEDRYPDVMDFNRRIDSLRQVIAQKIGQ